MAADVGGTYARLGLVRLGARGVPELLIHKRYAGAGFPSLAAVLCRFREDLAAEGVDVFPSEGVVAIAGLLQGDALLNANLPWPVSLSATLRDSGLQQFRLINDFEALAWALPHVPAGQIRPLAAGQAGGVKFPALLLGPGTGLGAALAVGSPGGFHVQPSEAGHAALAAGTARELDIVRVLPARFGQVDNERALSGTGLMNLYAALCELRGAAPALTEPAALVAAAEAGDDALAGECLALFCQWLGSVAGDLAITFCAHSVYLAGGLAGHLGQHLQAGGFMRRFLDKGVLSSALREVPVSCIEHGQLGIIGAAAWHAAHPAS
ncbi:MAG: glucokinase [Pseudoxanthomonas sp.]